MTEPVDVGLQRRVQQSGLRRLHLAGVAAPALDVEEQVAALQQLGDVGLERDQVGRVLGVAPDRDRAGDVAVQQPERPAEQVDPGGGDRRPDAVVVEHQRLDEVVEVRLVVRDVDDAAGARRLLRDLDVLLDALDLAQDRIERVLQRAVDGIALRGPQLVEVGVDPLARLQLALPVPAAQVARDVLAREDRLGDVVWEHVPRDYIKRAGLALRRRYRSISRQIASVNSVVVAVPPRSRVRTAPGRQHPRQRRANPLGALPARRCGRASSGPTAAAPSDSPGSDPRCPGALPCTASNTADLGPEVRPGHDAEPADQARAQVRHDVAVQIRQQQHVELLRVHHQVHARGVDDPLVVGDVDELARHLAAAVEEQAVAELHDVGLVDRRHPLAPVLPRVLEREPGDPRRRLLGDDLEALDDARARSRARVRRRDPRCSRGR